MTHQDFIIAEDCGCNVYHLYPNGTWRAETEEEHRLRLQGAYVTGEPVPDGELLLQSDHESMEKKIATDISDMQIPPVDGE